MTMHKKALEHKRWLRREKKEERNEIGDDELADAGHFIAEHIFKRDEYISADVVFCYLNFGKEVPTGEIIEDALAKGKTVCVPRCVTKTEMQACEYRIESDLIENSYGIKEPGEDARIIEKKDIDLAIVPCVTVDRRGNRCGYGAGYYDRFLENINCIKVALCMERIISEKVPVDEHDIAMDMVITEKQIYK